MRRFEPKTARLCRFTALLPWLLVAAAVSGCAGPTVAQTPREKAVGLYYDGLEHMRSGGFLEAQQVFQELVAMPAYLSVTSLARLRLADTLFQQRKYVEAFEIYMTYARRHDGSKNVPYARFMAARSRFEMVPTDFWLLPPVEEMDLSAADRARVLLERFIRRYPTSRHVTVAHQLRDRCIALQLKQHHYVVDFYRKRQAWLGVVHRLQSMMTQFPVQTHTLANYSTLSEAYERLRWQDRAVEMHTAILTRWPATAQSRGSRQSIVVLKQAIEQKRSASKPNEAKPEDLPPAARVRPEAAKESDIYDR
jgi:outer membrane protein assembly factor BamD